MKSLEFKDRRISFWKLLGTISLLLLLIVLFWSHNYSDLLLTTRHGINFWNILFDGQIHNFYHINITESGNVYYPDVNSCAYNILIYIIFAVWNIPLAILWKITSIDIMNNLLCLAWAKLLPVTAAVICARLVWLILEDLDVSKSRRQFATYLIFSSAILISAVFINCQYDTLGLVFQLLGIRCYLKKDFRGFIIYFGIAVCLKLFALIIMIPLLLIREKKLSKLLAWMVFAIVPYLVTTLPFSLVDAARGIEQRKSLFMELFPMLLSKANQNGLFYWFVVVYGALLIWCFLRNPKETSREDVLWVCFCAISSFFVFLHTYPYWIVLMVPYIALIFALSPNHLLPVMLLLETIGSCALVLKMMRFFDWTYWGNTMNTMVLPYLFPQQFENTVSRIRFLITTMNERGVLIVYSCIVLAFSAMAWLRYPEKTKCEKETLVLDREIVTVRFLAIAGVTLIPVLSLFL